MVSSHAQISSLSYALMQRATYGGQTYIPVTPSQAIYAHFEHVSGVPAQNGEGISIGKLQILNSLIDHLVSNTSQIERLEPSKTSDLVVDALLEQYRTELIARETQAVEIPYVDPMLRAGEVLSLTA